MARDPFPLQWPETWPRSKRRERSGFRVASFARTRSGVFRHLELMGAIHVVITSNLPQRLDGMPYDAAVDDPGIAVYWREVNGGGTRERVIACDRWDRARDNLHAIELSLGALRGLERWGSTEIVQRAFEGFAALPPAGHEWRAIFPGCRTLDEVKLAFRRAASEAHPDRHGGNDAEMVRLNTAYAAAKAELGAR